MLAVSTTKKTSEETTRVSTCKLLTPAEWPICFLLPVDREKDSWKRVRKSPGTLREIQALIPSPNNSRTPPPFFFFKPPSRSLPGSSHISNAKRTVFEYMPKKEREL